MKPSLGAVISDLAMETAAEGAISTDIEGKAPTLGDRECDWSGRRL
jgi:hypothetical protein